MTKRQKNAINKFVLKILRSGACVSNTYLPRKVRYTKNGATVIMPMFKFVKAWQTLRKALEG